MACLIISRGLLSELFSVNQFVHSVQKNPVVGLALLVLVLSFGESDLVHGVDESYAVCDGLIIVGFRTYLEVPWVLLLGDLTNLDSCYHYWFQDIFRWVL